MSLFEIKILVGLVLTLIILSGGYFFYKNTNDVDEILSQIGARYKNTRTRKLVICLDGVPWELVKELKDRGYFKIFHEPSKVFVSFPAMTNVSLANIWHKEPPEGYESLYFNRTANKFGGGSTNYVKKAAKKLNSYEGLLDYQEPKPYEFLVYLFPTQINKADLRRWLIKYFAHDKEAMYAFLKSSDGLTHVGGRETLRAFLIKLDAILNKIYAEKHGDMEISVFSDHGNDFIIGKRVDLEDYLEKNGFKVSDRIENNRSVVIPAFGLVSYAAIYTDEENKPLIAKLLSEREGVDFSVYHSADKIYVVGHKGEAVIAFNKADASYLYQPVSGDPLGLNSFLDRFKREGRTTTDGYVKDADWFFALRDHKYPDALHRIHQGIEGQVVHTADILVSFKEGYFYGSRLFGKMVTIRAMHGNLLDSNTAFFISTKETAPSHIRGEALLNYLVTQAEQAPRKK